MMMLQMSRRALDLQPRQNENIPTHLRRTARWREEVDRIGESRDGTTWGCRVSGWVDSEAIGVARRCQSADS